jgi:L-malate glycosyltransferase
MPALTCAPHATPTAGAPAPQAMVRVLFLIDQFDGADGGTEQHLLYLLHNLPRTRFALKVAVLYGREPSAGEHLGPFAPYFLDLLPRRSLSDKFRVARRVAAVIRDEAIDVVHTFFPASEAVALLAVWWARRGRVVAARRNVGHWHSPWSLWRARLQAPFIHHFLANCEAAKLRAAHLEGIPARRISVVPNPAPRQRIRDGLSAAKTRAELGIREGQRVVGIVGSIRPIKDHFTFLRAARLILDQEPTTRFLIVGRQWPDVSPALFQLADDLGIARQVVWTGQVDNPVTLMPLFDVAVLSSRAEGLANTLIEYAAVGLPTVATDVGGNREVVVDEETGFLVPPEDPALLADRVVRLLRDEPLRQAFGTKARARAAAAFSEERVLRAYEQFYRDVVARPS